MVSILSVSAVFLLNYDENSSGKKINNNLAGYNSMNTSADNISNSYSGNNVYSTKTDINNNKPIIKDKEKDKYENTSEIEPLTGEEALKIAREYIVLDEGLEFSDIPYDISWAWKINVFNKTTGKIVEHYIIDKYSGQITN